eukprot:152454-Chlamydomonas_euryale.AAC.1
MGARADVQMDGGMDGDRQSWMQDACPWLKTGEGNITWTGRNGCLCQLLSQAAPPRGYLGAKPV